MQAAIVFLLIVYCTQSEALKCYTCTYIQTQKDDTCVTNPAALKLITNCNKKFCTIVRQEYKDPANQIASFQRGCENEADNRIIDDDDTFIVYNTACSEDYCNGGDGKGSNDNGNGSDDAGSLLVPGTGSANQNVIIYSILIASLITLILF